MAAHVPAPRVRAGIAWAPVAWFVAGVSVAAVLLVDWGDLSAPPDQPAAAEPSAPLTASHPPPSLPPLSRPRVGPQATSPESTPREAEPTPRPRQQAHRDVEPAPSPSPTSPEPSPPSAAQALHDAGLTAFADALAALAPQFDQLERHVDSYNEVCYSLASALPNPSCVGLKERIWSLGGEVEESLDAAEEVARQSRVQPGERRQLRRQHGLERGRTGPMIRAARDLAESS